jgi:hypothetical protein
MIMKREVSMDESTNLLILAILSGLEEPLMYNPLVIEF